MKPIFAVLGVIFIQMASYQAVAQIAFTKTDTIYLQQDTLVLKIDNYHGNLSWQYSNDLQNWITIHNVAGDSLLLHHVDSSGYYRAKIDVGTCNPVFSDTTIVYSTEDFADQIVETMVTLFPEGITTLFKDEIEEYKNLPDYEYYLTEMQTVTNSLMDTIEKYYSPGELEQAIASFQSEFENPVLKSTNSFACTILNLGLGYSKGISVSAGVGGSMGLVIFSGLKAQQGGGAEITYDFVNQTRQVYIYKMCSLKEEYGVGTALGFQGNLGFSGYVKWLLNIPYYQQNTMGMFTGPSKSTKLGISPKINLGFGFGPNASIGTSIGIEGDCDNVYNLFQCPVYFSNQTPKTDGVISIIATAGLSTSFGPQTELVVAFSIENATSCSSGISETFRDFRGEEGSRKIAALKMALEVVAPSPITGVTSVRSSFDLIAAASAIVYGALDVENCPVITFPTVSTNLVTRINENSADVLGNVESEGGAEVTSRGICWNTSGSPTVNNNSSPDGDGEGNFAAKLTDLSPNTTYFTRAFASNSQGTSYGKELSFTTLPEKVLPNTFIDKRDGHVYKTVIIGDQTWMAENLAYLPTVSTPDQTSPSEPHHYVYNYFGNNVNESKSANYQNYGVLYNYTAALNVCPSGWHLPEDEEWKQLEIFLGMSPSDADFDGLRGTGQGYKLKSTYGWNGGGNGSNSSGFNGLPGGVCSDNGFYLMGNFGFWWSSTLFPQGNTCAYGRFLPYNCIHISRGGW